MIEANGWHWRSGVKGTETAQNGPEFRQDREPGAFGTFSYLMN
jgi:hypothetical protein